MSYNTATTRRAMHRRRTPKLRKVLAAVPEDLPGTMALVTAAVGVCLAVNPATVLFGAFVLAVAIAAGAYCLSRWGTGRWQALAGVIAGTVGIMSAAALSLYLAAAHLLP